MPLTPALLENTFSGKLEVGGATPAFAAVVMSNILTDATFASTYDDRYFKDEWESDEPPVLVRELDVSVFKQKKIEVPSKTHSDSSLSRQHATSPIYLIQPQDLRSETPIPKIIGSTSFASIPVALRRLEFKYSDHMSGRFVPTLFINSVSNHLISNPLLVVPDSVFMGDLYSEIGNQITVYNTHKIKTVNIDNQTPIGILFDKWPVSQSMLPVTAQELSNTNFNIEANGKKKMKLVKFENLQEDMTGPALFTTSLGACNIPPGIFFDEVITDDGYVTFYNITPKNLTISLLDDNFLGYACTINSNHTTIDIKDDEVTEINMSTVNTGDVIKVKSHNNINIPPFTSMFIKGGNIQITNTDTYYDPESSDRNYKLIKYARVVSYLQGCIPMTPFIESQTDGNTNQLCFYLFNATSEPKSVKQGEIVACLLISAACLPFKYN